ncbi:stress transcription factor A [Seminavis robusta]|uniref:Stress transcription factor A n=1 Tax=Seminavis robusta TaxID=568900 RepID=A0A9N8EVG4_9STRA|nr:stress transcription factor A [Seminavis robusta]|eukprot:Sro1802_g298540.1 stress transcription factor A (387) ;mRNA; f:6586-8037
MNMDHLGFSPDEHMAASAVASLATSKRKREDEDVEMQDCNKMVKTDAESRPLKPVKKAPIIRVMRPAPFFFYKDFSRVPDNDPLTPLTVPGRVPNFPAKMHAILSRTDLRGIVTWQPHGRAWRVLKPREFEVKVLPKFFEHAKFSSFVRQANGWGFRRITQGADRNCYYHEKFLRGLPHLCKDVKRPGVAEKKVADPAHEPDLYAISKLHPVPEKVAADESILLQCVLQGGPKARVPIYPGGMGFLPKVPIPNKTELATHVAPGDCLVLDSFQQTIAASESQFRGLGVPPATVTMRPTLTIPNLPLPAYLGTPGAASALLHSQQGQRTTLSALATANHLSMQPAPTPATVNPTASRDFAAGFAMATAFSQQQFRNILDNLAQHQKK